MFVILHKSDIDIQFFPYYKPLIIISIPLMHFRQKALKTTFKRTSTLFHQTVDFFEKKNTMDKPPNLLYQETQNRFLPQNLGLN